MTPPTFRLIDLDPILTRAARHEGGAAPVAALECVAPGVLDGVAWEPGQRAAAIPGVLDGDAIVLLPRGRGRPMAGRLAEGFLLGPWGERCAPQRWDVAGRLVGPFRRAGRRWQPAQPVQPALFAA